MLTTPFNNLTTSKLILTKIMTSNWTNWVGNLALVWTIGLFLCGVQICHKIFRDKSVGDISPFPFLAAFLNCVLNFIYGILIDNKQIIIVNFVGFNLEAVYILFFLYYTLNRRKVIHQIVFVLSICSFVWLYVYYFNQSDSVESAKSTANTVGFFSSLASIIMFGSPLVSIKNVMKSRSTESLSFPLCLANFVCSTLWSFYGILINDKFVFIPNIVGGILGFAQVSLFAKFPQQSFVTRSNKYKSDDPIM